MRTHLHLLLAAIFAAFGALCLAGGVQALLCVAAGALAKTICLGVLGTAPATAPARVTSQTAITSAPSPDGTATAAVQARTLPGLAALRRTAAALLPPAVCQCPHPAQPGGVRATRAPPVLATA